MNKWAGVLLICAVFSACGFAGDVGKKAEFTFGVHFASTAGTSSSQQFNYADTFTKVLSEDYGFNFKVVRFSSQREVTEAFLLKKIDAAMFYPGSVVEIIERGGGVYPLTTYVVGKQRKTAYCMWHRKDDEINEVSDVIGKTILSPDYDAFGLAVIRDFLYQNGIDRPLWEVFKTFTRAPAGNSAIMALAMGDADVAWGGADFRPFLKMINPNVASKLTFKFCTDSVYSRHTVVFNKKTVTEAEFRGLKENLKRALDNLDGDAKKNNELKAFNEYLKMAKMKFIFADENEFKADIGVYQKAKEKGWIDEVNFILEQFYEIPIGKTVRIRPDYKMCKKVCAGAGNRETCLDECME